MPKVTDYQRKCRDIYRDFKSMFAEGKRLAVIYDKLREDYYLKRDALESIVAKQRAAEKTKK